MPLEQKVTFHENKKGWKKLRSSKLGFTKEDIVIHVSSSFIFMVKANVKVKVLVVYFALEKNN